MDELLGTLKNIGFPAEECERIKAYYDGDIEGLKQYVLYCKAMFDDRHEYLA